VQEASSCAEASERKERKTQISAVVCICSAKMEGGIHALSWYLDIPVVSRCYLTGAVLTTLLCFLEIVSPLTLYYNYDLVVNKGQYWRLFSSFMFFGSFNLDFLFHLYFVVRYCRLLEEGSFRGKTADLLYMLLFGAFVTLLFPSFFPLFSKIKFLGHPLAFMMVYLWARGPEQRNVRMSLLGLFPFNAPYLPWVLLLFSLFLRNPIESDVLGIIVGHIYYFLHDIYPQVAAVRGWSLKQVLVAPAILHWICGSFPDAVVINHVEIQENHLHEE
jgi:Derlin-2/3